MDEASTRRRVLAGVSVATVAGCLTGGDGSGDGGTDADGGTGEMDGSGSGGTTGDAGTGDTTGSDGGTTGSGDEAGGSGGATTSADDLDLREANVTDVALEPQGGGDVRLSVTLIHDDDGEDGYANWWAVETRDGEELGRRGLAHAHGTREFTRSETVSVPGDAECVVVRGHDQTHEYGGQAAVVSMASGATRFARQGSDPSSFADADCP